MYLLHKVLNLQNKLIYYTFSVYICLRALALHWNSANGINEVPPQYAFVARALIKEKLFWHDS